LRSFDLKRVHVLRVDQGKEVLREILRVCDENGIKAAIILGLGLLSRSKIAFFDIETQSYRYMDLEEPMELASLVGNVSLKEGKPFAHVHVVLGNERGTSAGHLVEGYAGGTVEITIFELEGELLRGIVSGGLVLLNV
jgi:predicted DNA-binding protein with PD1-like motif